MDEDKDNIHEKLLKEYLEYFKIHEKFEKVPSVRNYAKIRKNLKDLRALVKERYDETKVFYLESKKGRRRKK